MKKGLLFTLMIFLASGVIVAIAVVAVIFYANDKTASVPKTIPTNNNLAGEVVEPISQIDSDNDGISDRDEAEKYHTNSRNPDTDGDGYDDKTEIINGFNPLENGI